MNASSLWQENMQAGIPLAGQGLVFLQGMKALRTEAVHLTDLAPTLLAFMEIEPGSKREGQVRL
jgi:hypothetical protein